MIAERTFLRHDFGIGHGGRRHIGGDDPGLGCKHGEVEHGLEVRLVEYCVDTTGVRHFELGIKIDVAIGRINATMQTFASIGVLAQSLDGDLVMRFKILELNAVVGEGGRRIEGLTVQHDFTHFVGDEVEEAVRSRLCVEGDGGFGSEILGSVGQIKADRVMDRRRNGILAFFGFDTGEVCSWHVTPCCLVVCTT